MYLNEWKIEWNKRKFWNLMKVKYKYFVFLPTKEKVRKLLTISKTWLLISKLGSSSSSSSNLWEAWNVTFFFLFKSNDYVIYALSYAIRFPYNLPYERVAWSFPSWIASTFDCHDLEEFLEFSYSVLIQKWFFKEHVNY